MDGIADEGRADTGAHRKGAEIRVTRSEEMWSLLQEVKGRLTEKATERLFTAENEEYMDRLTGFHRPGFFHIFSSVDTFQVF